MNIIVCGSRSIKNYNLVKEVIEESPFDDIEMIIHGGAVGVDSLTDIYATVSGIKTRKVKPDYNKYSSKKAPIERNKEILDPNRGVEPDGMIAIWDRMSSGTEFMITKASESEHLVRHSTAYKGDDYTVIYFIKES